MAESATELPPTEYVYVIGAADSHLVKIGRTNNVSKRLGELQRMSPIRLEVLWQTEGGSWLEAALHRTFKDARAHGEWFEFPHGNAAERVSSVITELMTQAAEEQRVREERARKRRLGRKARKLRKVWISPSRLKARRRKQEERNKTPGMRRPESINGFTVGDVVRITDPRWPHTPTAIIRLFGGQGAYVEENDGLKHYYLPQFSFDEIRAESDVEALPKADVCSFAGCFCARMELQARALNDELTVPQWVPIEPPPAWLDA